VEDNVVVVLPPPVAAEYAAGLDLLQPLEAVLPPAHPEPLSVEGGVATYVSRGRAYRGPAPSVSLPPRGHGAGGSPPVQGFASPVGRGRAGFAAFIRSLRNPGLVIR